MYGDAFSQYKMHDQISRQEEEKRAINDCELEYIRNMQKNEVLSAYFNAFKEGFTCTLIQSKIALNGRIKLNGSTDLTNAMAAAS